MTSYSGTVTHHNNIGLWIHDSTNVGDEAFWPQYIILTQSGTLSHTCLWGANVSLDRLLEKKQCNRQKDSADLYPLCSAPFAPSNFCFLLFCPLWLPLTYLHFPFLLILSLLMLPFLLLVSSSPSSFWFHAVSSHSPLTTSPPSWAI